MFEGLERFLLPCFDAGDGGGGGDPAAGGDDPAGGGNPAGEDNKGHMIPKHRFDEVSKKAKEYEVAIAEMGAKLKEVEAKDQKIAALEEELKTLKKTHETEKVTSKKVQIIKERVGDKVVDFDMFLTLLDLNTILVNSEGKVKGLSDQVKAIQKSKPYLWKPAQSIVKPGASDKTKTEKTFAQKLAEKKKAQNELVNKGKNYF